jgi:hypothetical protein
MNPLLQEKIEQIAARVGVGVDFAATRQREAYPGLRPWARFYRIVDDYSILAFESVDDMAGLGEKLVEDGLGFSVVSSGRDPDDKDEETFRSMVTDWGLLDSVPECDSTR